MSDWLFEILLLLWAGISLPTKMNISSSWRFSGVIF